MNTLSFTTSQTEDGFFICLKVDEQPIVPYSNGVEVWYCEKGIPSFPPDQTPTGRVMIDVCSCGHWGCGSSEATLSRDNGKVKLFDFNAVEMDKSVRYEFLESEFDRVNSEIALLASDFVKEWKAKNDLS